MNINICGYYPISSSQQPPWGKRYSLIYLIESNIIIETPTCKTRNLKLFFLTSKEMGSNHRVYFWRIFTTSWPPKKESTVTHTQDICEKYVSHLSDFERFLLRNDGQPILLHHKIEKKKNLESNKPTISMSQIQKIPKHKVLHKTLVVKYKLLIWYLTIQNRYYKIFLLQCNVTISTYH